jgi:hypothetical protein
MPNKPFPNNKRVEQHEAVTNGGLMCLQNNMSLPLMGTLSVTASIGC